MEQLTQSDNALLITILDEVLDIQAGADDIYPAVIDLLQFNLNESSHMIEHRFGHQINGLLSLSHTDSELLLIIAAILRKSGFERYATLFVNAAYDSTKLINAAIKLMVLTQSLGSRPETKLFSRIAAYFVS